MAKTKNQQGRKKAILTAVILVILIIAVSSYLFSKRWKENQVVIVVNNEKIYEDELAQIYDQLKLQGPSTTRSSAAKEIITIKILLQEAKRRGITVSETELEDAINKIKSSTGIALEDELKKSGISYDFFRERIKQQIITQKLINQIIQNVSVNEKEISGFFEENKDSLLQENYRLAQLVVRDEATANDLKRQLDDGAEFSTLAQQFSVDDATKGRGGDIGVLAKSDLTTEIAPAVAVLKIGDVSKPVKMNGIFYLVKLIDKKNKGETTLADVHEQIARFLSERKAENAAQALLKNLTDNAEINIYDPTIQNI